MAENPFSIAREARSITLTFRVTPTEHAALKAAADAGGVDIVDLIREGLRLALDARPKAPRKELKR